MTYHLHNAGGAEYALEATGTKQVTKCRIVKESPLEVYPMPGDDSDATYADDMDGVTRKISLEGTVTDTLANIQTFITTVEAYIDGAQMADSTRHVFHCDLTNADYTVAIERFEYEQSNEEPTETLLKYRLEMTQTAT